MFTLHRAALVFLASAAFVFRIVPGVRTVDDAFITFRYSRNIAEGHGFVYNLGERILGTTTPLYASLMALLGALWGGDYPWLALVVNAFAGALGVVLLAWIAHRLTDNPYVAGWIAVAWVVAPFSVTFSIGGMETPVHNAFMLGAWFAYLDERPRLMGAMCALGVLTRPDALIWALPLLAHHLWRVRRIPWGTWLTGLILFAPWAIFATVYFGSPLPHTVSTKAAVYSLESTQAFIGLLRHYATPFNAQLTLGRVAIMVGIVLYPVLSLIGLRAASAKEGRALPILLYPWLYFAVFSLANPLLFRWYFTPPLPAYFLAIGCGVAALLALIPREHISRYVPIGIGLAALIFGLNAWELSPEHGYERPAPKMAFHELELNYAEMARTLRRDHGLTDDSVLAAGDIGALGYYSRAHIFDTVGLVTEGTVPYYEWDSLESIRDPSANYVIPPDLIIDAEPDFVVVMDLFVRDGLLQDPRFTEAYEQIEFIPTEYYGDGMYAFKRVTPLR